ncbi:MAG TPA: LTA synthase family protein, partial [Rhodoferax sp.]|nr:LTA synthase family protein [Rhodoferax sp.]
MKFSRIGTLVVLREVPFLHHVVLFLALASLTRFILTAVTGLSAVGAGNWPSLMLRGLTFDLLVLVWLLSPALLWAAMTPSAWRETRWRQNIRLVLFWCNASFLLFIALAEVTFWDEFATRFNFIAVDYLLYTHEVIGNVLESYPVALLLAGVGGLALILTWVFRRQIAAVRPARLSATWRLVYGALALLLPLLAWHVA